MALPYTPDPATEALISDIKQKREQWKRDRQVHEQQWFTNAAFDRGQHHVEWNDKFQRLIVPPTPPHRIRIKTNRIQAKNRNRFSKFIKNRPKPIVVPATSEYDDYMDAKLTQKALDYQWRRIRLEVKLRKALLWARNCSKGFWWYHWDPTKVARIFLQDPQTGQKSYEERQLGDIAVEVGSPFEVLVADPGVADIGSQPEIMRVKLRMLDDVRQRYPEFADYMVAETADHELFRFERNIALLNPTGWAAGNPTNYKSRDDSQGAKKWVLVTEHFCRPSGKYPKGSYKVLVGDILVKNQDELPYGFDDLENPFPVTEFADVQAEGQFWSSTVAEQAIDVQKQLNLQLSKAAEHIRQAAFPKLMVAKQHQLSKSAWTTEAGEIIEYVAIPSVPPPQSIQMQAILGDVWRFTEQLDAEIDEIYQIWPSSEGSAAGATSGFQTNLLQEASDGVHAPDIRGIELAVEEAALKLRRMMKLGYDVPRLMAIVGPNYQPEVFEFSQENIDELADVQVEAGSALPTLKSARQETVMNLYNSGLMGDVNDPEVKRRALSLLEMGSLEETFDIAKADENQARWENSQFAQWVPQPGPPVPVTDPMTGAPIVDPMTGQPQVAPGPPVPPVDNPHFWENHLIHYNVHTTWLKSPEGRSAPPTIRHYMILHVVLHGRFINPQSALQIAIEEGIQEVIPMLQALVAPPPPAQGAPATPQAPAQPAPPQGQAAPPPPVQ